MKKKLFALLSSILAMIMCFSSLQIAASATDKPTTLSVMSANVAGLPIPSAFSENDKVVPTAQKKLGKMLNDCGVDVICVQEDFQYHPILAAQMTNYEYSTYTSGGIPAGDGLNIFSKYPIYNVERVAWEMFCGILTHANDGLTPKGLLKCTVNVSGVLVDIYDVHIDANGSEEDCAAKREQFLQLTEYIKANSADRPVFVIGDFNCTLHTDMTAGFYETMIVDNGFKDGWAEVFNGGNYFRGDDANSLINDYYRDIGGFWGVWDSVERVLYRDGDGARLLPVKHEYKYYTDSDTDLMALTDHAFMTCTFEINTENYVAPSLELIKEKRTLFIVRVFHFMRMIVRCLGLIIPDAIRLLKEKIKAN